jgi:hypothetical protein
MTARTMVSIKATGHMRRTRQSSMRTDLQAWRAGRGKWPACSYDGGQIGHRCRMMKELGKTRNADSMRGRRGSNEGESGGNVGEDGNVGEGNSHGWSEVGGGRVRRRTTTPPQNGKRLHNLALEPPRLGSSHCPVLSFLPCNGECERSGVL